MSKSLKAWVRFASAAISGLTADGKLNAAEGSQYVQMRDDLCSTAADFADQMMAEYQRAMSLVGDDGADE